MRQKNVGHPLVALLVQGMDARDMTVSELASEIGLSQSYLSELLREDKSFSKVDMSRLRSIAVFLELPAVSVFMLAGKLLHEDFLGKPHVISEQLQSGMRRVAQSSYGLKTSVSESMLERLPVEVKTLLAVIFQAATGESLIPSDDLGPR